MTGPNIGDAEIQVEIDFTKFEKDLEKVKKELEGIDATATVHAKLDKKARSELQAQLDGIKNLRLNVTPYVTKARAQEALDRVNSLATSPKLNTALSFTRKQLNEELKRVGTPAPKLKVDLEVKGALAEQLKALKTISQILEEGNALNRVTNRLLQVQSRQHRANLDNLRLIDATVTSINDGFARSIPFVEQQRQGLRDTQNNFRRILQQIFDINKIKDPFPVIAASTLSSELLLNKLARVLREVFLLRKSFVQIGAIAGTAFAGIAQAAGAAAIGVSNLIAAGLIGAGIGLITIGVRLQILNDAEVKASVDNLKKTFNDVFTEASKPLGPVIKDFSNDMSKAITSQKAAFTGFFNTVAPGLKAVGKAFSDFVGSEKFAKLINAIGASTANFLEKFAAKLPAIIQGIEDIGKKFLEISPRIKKALGPGIFSGLSVDKVIAGLERFTKIIESAGQGIRAFKAAFGNVFGELINQVEIFAKVLGQVGPSLFDSLGKIGVSAVRAFGTALDGALIGATKALAIAQGSLSTFIEALGTNAANSFIILGDAVGHVVDRASQLGTILAPLITIAAELSAALEPVVTPIFNVLDAVGRLAVAVGQFLVPAFQGFIVAITPAVAVLGLLGQALLAVGDFIVSVISPFSGLIGAIAGVIVVVGTFTAAISAIGGFLGTMALGVTVLGGATVGLGATISATAAKIPILSSAITAFSASQAAGAATTGLFGRALAVLSPSLAAYVGSLGGASVSSRLFAASATNAAIAARLAGTSSIAGAAGFGLLAGAQGVAAVASRVFGVALRFALGPIGLLIAAVLLFSGALDGLATIAKGVGDIIVGLFTFDTDKISQGWEKVKQGAKDVGNAVVETFTGSGGEAGQGMGDAAAEGVKSGFEGIKLDAGAAGKASGKSFLDQFKGSFEGLNFQDQIAGIEGLFKEGGILAGDGFVESAQDRLLAANIAEAVHIDQGIIDQFKQTGDAAGSGLVDALRAKMTELSGASEEGRKQLESLVAYGKSIGGSSGDAIVREATAKLNAGAPGAQKAAADALKPPGGEAAKQGQEAAKELIESVTQALEQGGPQITASLSLAFDSALNTLGTQILGPKLASTLDTAFKFMIASSTGLSSQITAALSLAFDTAFTTLGTGVLGPKLAAMLTTAFQFLIGQSAGLSSQITAAISLAFDAAFLTLGTAVLPAKLSNMLSVAFATSITTSAGTLTPQIVASLSLAFDGAFAILPAILGPKISLMLGNIFATTVIDGLPLAGALTRVFTGAFGLAFISLPAVIAPGLNKALTDGSNQALQSFGTGLQGQINAAFTTAFSGVGEAINGPLSAAFLGATGSAQTFAATIGGSMQTAASNITSALASLSTDIPKPIQDGMNAAVTAAQTGANDLVKAVQDAKAKIVAIDFYGPGYQIGARLAAGIRAATAAEVIPAADAMAAAVKDRTPNSPAKKGPLSGPGDPLRTGANIVKRLVEGMKNERPELVDTITKLMAEFNRRQAQFGLGTNQDLTSNKLTIGPAPLGSEARNLTGRFDPNIKGSILKQDTQATVGPTTNGNVLQIRPGQVNITVPGTDDPREFINNLSKELLTSCTGR